MEGIIIRFRLEGKEAQALECLAAKELRNPRQQVRYILRRELERRGLLPPSADKTPSKNRSRS